MNIEKTITHYHYHDFECLDEPSKRIDNLKREMEILRGEIRALAESLGRKVDSDSYWADGAAGLTEIKIKKNK